MSRAHRLSMLLLVALAAVAGSPVNALAGPHGGGHHHGGHHGSISHSRTMRGHTARARVRDHRGPARPYGHRPNYDRHVYWPYSYRYGYWPYYGYDYVGYYPYYGPPGNAELVAPPSPSPRPRSRVALAVHVGQLERDDDIAAGIAGLALRWRGRVLEGELELGRRVYTDSDFVERSLAATLYANLGDIDALHPYLLAGAGVLDADRVFGAVGAGLALPFASRLTLAADVRAASIGEADHHDNTVRDTPDRTLEGRLTLVVDF